MEKGHVAFISGAMGGGKSAQLIDMIRTAREMGEQTLCLKPRQDERDGLVIKSRKYEKTYPAVAIPERVTKWSVKLALATIIEGHSPDVIFVDEVQFIDRDVVEYLVGYCRHNDIIIVFAGLLKDFKGEFFPASEFLAMHSDYYRFIPAICECGKQARNSLRLVNDAITFEGSSVMTEDKVAYIVMCNECMEYHTGRYGL